MSSDVIKTHIIESIEAKQRIMANTAILEAIAEAGKLCVGALRQGNKILVAGNGGSAADAQHIAAELVGRYRNDRAALPAIAMTTDTSALTAIGNDYGYEQIFSRQLEALSRPGDVFLAISTSGNSRNLLQAAHFARDHDVSVIGLLGRNGALAPLSNIAIAVPADQTATIQECHIMLGHILCALIETALFD